VPTARQQALLDWYAQAARELPWRGQRDPYRVLVSEVMLQQTQVARVVPFFVRWIERFPDAAHLAQADDDTLHRLWKGLGYPSRAERLREACRSVVARGGWPVGAEALQELPGIGPYTARAVAAFAQGQPAAVLDTNVARVLCRANGVDPGAGRAALQVAAEAAAQGADPVRWNNAIMELGALICTARSPACDDCPWRRGCRARGDAAALAATAAPLKAQVERPVYGDPPPPRGTPVVRVVLALVHDQGRYLVAMRPRHLHAGGAYELPGGKRDAGEDDRTALARELREEIGGELLAARHLMTYWHRYPDRWVQLRIYRCRLFDAAVLRPLASDGLRWCTPAELVALPMPPGNAPLIARLRRYHRMGATDPAGRGRRRAPAAAHR
jgi:A/G-specific adenine glycosylase